MQDKIQFRIAARALVVEDNRLLLVSDNGEYWYLPGGRLELSESLTDCVEREVYEETGLSVKTGPLLHVLECFDLNDHQHKIHFYFQTTTIAGTLTDSWCDQGGSVQFQRYFSLEEIQDNKKILPRFLASGDWCQVYSQMDKVYQGTVHMRGFEMIDAAETV